MVNDVKFSIEFYKVRKSGNTSQQLQIQEQLEVCEEASFKIEALAFFIAASSDYAMEHLDSESYQIYLESISEIIGGFMQVVRNGLSEIDKRRIELEEKVKKLEVENA